MRRLSLASLAAILIAVPSGASAATQIGETFVPTSGNCSDLTLLQSISPAGQYAAPSDGVITRWSFQAPASGTDLLKFKVARPAPGADLTGNANFTIIGESSLKDPAAGSLNSFFIQIPVLAGDVIGFYWNDGNAPQCLRSDPDYDWHYKTGDVTPPTTTEFSQSDNLQFDVSAVLEPDCDKDGFGDETQDTNLPTPPCPTQLTCKGEGLTIVGTDGPDEIVGTPNRDVIGALDGNDKVRGLDGRDLICGGKNKDTLKGGKAKDRLLGQKGADTLKGGGGNDTCKGGKGDDVEKSC